MLFFIFLYDDKKFVFLLFFLFLVVNFLIVSKLFWENFNVGFILLSFILVGVIVVNLDILFEASVIVFFGTLTIYMKISYLGGISLCLNTYFKG